MKVYARQPVDIYRMRVPRGRVYLVPERCKGCRMCVDFCPREVLQVSTARNSKGYHYPEVTPGKEEACVNCQFCMLICPEFAIFSVEVDSL